MTMFRNINLANQLGEFFEVQTAENFDSLLALCLAIAQAERRGWSGRDIIHAMQRCVEDLAEGPG